MKKAMAFLLASAAVFSLCACSQTSDYSIPSQYETSSIIGVRDGNTMRFDDFGLTLHVPEECYDGWATDIVPETFEELDEIISSEDCYMVSWTDFETADGQCNFNVQIMKCDDGAKESDFMNYFLDSYSGEVDTKRSEIKKISLGDNPKQKCFSAYHINDDGVEEDLLIFDKLSGNYYIECAARTYGWEGAEALAQQIFSVDEPLPAANYETFGILGFMDDESLRFDDFSLTIKAPNDYISNEWASRSIPETFDILNSTLESDGYYDLFWQDFETDQGGGTINAAIIPNDGSASESIRLSWQEGYYRDDVGASECNIVSLPLGDNENQKCLVATFTNDEGTQENVLTIYKHHGNYCLECNIRTYNWEGAVDTAKELLQSDAPARLPFSVDSSGLFVLDDSSLFGKTVEELGSIIGAIADPVDFPWWNIDLTCSVIDCGDYPVSLLFDSDGKLSYIMCEDVESEKFQASFEEAKNRFNDIYYYQIATSSFFPEGKVYSFYVDDSCKFSFAKCSSEGTDAISQRYVANPITDLDLLDFSTYIANGELPALSTEHALKLVDHVTAHSTDPDVMDYAGHFYAYGIKDYDEALVWYTKAADLGSADAVNDIGALYENAYSDYKTALEYYEKAGNLGSATGMNNAGSLYSKTYNDPDAAFAWFKKAADTGDYFGCLNCGRAYILGNGTEIDYEKGYTYLFEAYMQNEESDYHYATIELSDLYDCHYDELSENARTHIETILGSSR